MRILLLPVLPSFAMGLPTSDVVAIPRQLGNIMSIVGIVGVVGILGVLAVLVFELVARRREAEKTKQEAVHAAGTHRRPPPPPVRVLHFGQWPVDADKGKAISAPVSRWHWLRAVRSVALAVVTPLLEKNVLKTISLDVPVVFSMSRVVVLAFAVGMLRHIWRAGIAGWPEAALAIAVVLAMPVLGALERAAPVQVVELTKALISQYAAGGVWNAANVHSASARKPSQLDDHGSG